MVDSRRIDRNLTSAPMAFEKDRWYRVRLRVTEARIEAWVDDKSVVGLPTAGHAFSPPPDYQAAKPLGVHSWQGVTALRNIRLRLVEGRPAGERINAAELAIPAQADWYHTGLLVAKGQRYEITASGRWGQAAFMSSGPGGEPGAGFGHLLGRVGTDPQDLAIGERASFIARGTGILYLGFRDTIWDDNWGSLLVSVKGPLLADKHAPLLSRFTKALARGQVNAQKDWASSGVDVERGDRILITATGTWSCAGQATDANGANIALSGHRAGMLLGRIGEEGSPFEVGTLRVIEALETGKLYLRMNSLGPAGNSGSVEVTIRGLVKRKAP